MSNYPDNFNGPACDAAQGVPVDYNYPLLNRLKAVQIAAAALEKALMDLSAVGYGSVQLGDLEAREHLDAIKELTEMNAYEVEKKQTEIEEEYINSIPREEEAE